MLALDVRLGVTFTDHALIRLNERAWQLPFQSVAEERLTRIVEHGQLRVTRPAWLHPTTSDADAWLVIGDLAFPLVQSDVGFVAVTCLARGGLRTTADRRTRADGRRQADRARSRKRRHDERCGSSTVRAESKAASDRTRTTRERFADPGFTAADRDLELVS